VYQGGALAAVGGIARLVAVQRVPGDGDRVAVRPNGAVRSTAARVRLWARPARSRSRASAKVTSILHLVQTTATRSAKATGVAEWQR
jgi:hypothetical protein